MIQYPLTVLETDKMNHFNANHSWILYNIKEGNQYNKPNSQSGNFLP